MASQSGPLQGIRVLELGQFLSGPYCGMLLADMGAQVIKVEPRMGDPLRLLLGLIGPELEVLFHALNRNKLGIRLDLRNGLGAEILRKLVAKSDILIENLGPGTMERYGLGYSELSKINPGLIYVKISGFGSTGPYSQRTSFDVIAQSMGGTIPLMARVGNKPRMFIGDIVAGIFGALGAVQALWHRSRTGEGQLVDISMQDVVFSINLGGIIESSLDPHKLQRLGMSFVKYPPGIKIPLYGIYPARDGEIAIGAILDSQAIRLFQAMGKPELIQRYGNFLERLKGMEELDGILAEWSSKLTRNEIFEILNRNRVPCGMVYQLHELRDDPQLNSREMIVEISKDGKKYRIPGVCIKLSRSPGSIRVAGPKLGEHTHQILAQILGYSEDDIKELAKAGVI